jgi:hypothetical protein
LAFPLADWILSGLIATYFTGSSVVESSVIATLGLIAVLYTCLVTRSIDEEAAEVEKKGRRNELLAQEINDARLL